VTRHGCPRPRRTAPEIDSAVGTARLGAVAGLLAGATAYSLTRRKRDRD
jgi:hypothetical protein